MLDVQERSFCEISLVQSLGSDVLRCFVDLARTVGMKKMHRFVSDEAKVVALQRYNIVIMKDNNCTNLLVLPISCVTSPST